LPLEPVEQREPLFKLCQAFGRSLDSASVIAERRAYILDGDASRLQRRKRILKLRLVAEEFFDMLLRRAQTRRCGRIALVQQVKCVHGRAVDAFGVGQDALFRFKPLVFARLQTRLLDLATLKGPKIEQTDAILFIALQIRDTAANFLPGGESG